MCVLLCNQQTKLHALHRFAKKKNTQNKKRNKQFFFSQEGARQGGQFPLSVCERSSENLIPLNNLTHF